MAEGDHLDYPKPVYSLDDLLEDRNKEIEQASQGSPNGDVIIEKAIDQGTNNASNENPVKKIPPGFMSSTASDIPEITTPIQNKSRCPRENIRVPMMPQLPSSPPPPPGSTFWRGALIATTTMPYLDRVTKKYGDIFSGMKISSPNYVALTAQSLAKCISILDWSSPMTVTSEAINYLDVTMKDLQALGVNTDWITSRVASIKAHRGLAVENAYLNQFKREEAEAEAKLEGIRGQVRVARARVEELESKLALESDKPLSHKLV